MTEMMMEPRNYLDLKGRMFGQLVVISDAGLDKFDVRVWRCNCSCGKNGIKIVEPKLLEAFLDRCDACMMKHYTSFDIPMRAGCKSIHAALQDTCYESWYNMIQRYLSYSRDPESRPIRDRISGIDPRWKRFENFYKDMNPRKPGTELSRIDKDGGFSKENVRWMTRAEAMVGRRIGQGSLVRPVVPTSYIAELKGAKTVPVVEKQASIIPLINHSQFKKELIVTMRADANAQIEAGSRMHHEAGKKIEEARALLLKLAEVEKALDLISSFKGAK